MEKKKKEMAVKYFFLFWQKRQTFSTFRPTFVLKIHENVRENSKANIIASTLAEREREPFSDVNPFKTADRREQH